MKERKVFQLLPYKRAFTENHEQYGNFKDSYVERIFLQIDLLTDGLNITLLDGTESVHRFRLGIIAMFDLQAINIVHRFQLEFQYGISLYEGFYGAPRIRKLIIDCLCDSDKHTMVRNRQIIATFHASDSSTHTVHLPDGDVLVYADQHGCKILGGTGNQVFKVTGSPQLVNTGRCANLSGHDIVHIASDAEKISVQLIAVGDTYVQGNKFIVMEGVTTGVISVSRTNGTPIRVTPGTTFFAFMIKEGLRILTDFDAVPAYFLFGYAGEYEVVTNPTAFLQRKSENSWVTRYIVNQERMVMLVATDVESTQLLFDVSSVGTNNHTSVIFENIHSLSIAVLTLEYSRGSSIRKGDLAVQIATYIPGGIRFRDRTVSSSEIVSFLHDVLNKSETKFDSTMGFIAGNATDTLDSMLARNNPNSIYLDVLATCHETFRITNVDPSSSE